jgi:iron complex outermembrane receptor protein
MRAIKSRAMRQSRAILLLGAASAAFTAPAFAQQDNSDPANAEGDPIVVTGAREKFRPTESSSATKFDLPLVETPQAISVLDDTLLNITESENLQDIAALIPGITSPGTDGLSTFLLSRGVELSPRFGFKVNGAEIQQLVIDFSAVDRVESIRGPASVIFGQTDFGGILNTVLKAPTRNTQIDASFEIGEFDSYRADLNVSGPLNEEGSIRARGDFAWDQANSFQEFRNSRIFSGHGSVDFDLGAATTLETSFYIYEQTGNNDFGFPAAGFDEDGNARLSPILNGDITNVPRERFFGAPPIVPGLVDPGSKQDGYLLLAELEHEFADNLELFLKVARLETSVETRQPSATGLNDDGTTLLYDFFSSENFESHTFNATLRGEFDLFGQTHKWLVDGYYRTLRNDDSRTISTGIGSVDIFDPDYSDLILDAVDPSTLDEQRDALDDWAIAGVLLLEPADRLTVMVGGRYQGTDERTTLFDPDGVFIEEIFAFKDEKFVPRFGITYGITEDIYVYGSYSEGIIFNGGIDASGRNLAPETGEQIEFGAKGEFLNGRLGASIIYYDIARSNFAVPDPDNPLFSTTVDGGDFSGLEVEVVGEPIPGLNVLLTYNYQNNSVVQDDGDGALRTVGFVPNVPEHALSAFVSYEFLEGPLEGFRFGTGLIHEGSRASDFGNPGETRPAVTLPAFTRIDLNTAYQITEGIQIYANWKNITDEDIIGSFFQSSLLGLNYVDVSELSAGVRFKF